MQAKESSLEPLKTKYYSVSSLSKTIKNSQRQKNVLLEPAIPTPDLVLLESLDKMAVTVLILYWIQAHSATQVLFNPYPRH
jgi:hypothetical protein